MWRISMARQPLSFSILVLHAAFFTNGPENPPIFFNVLRYLPRQTEVVRGKRDCFQEAVDSLSRGKKYTICDGVGFPSVGACVGVSNAEVTVPKLL